MRDEHERWEYGARRYLSGEDVASLSAPQRTLWSLQHDLPPPMDPDRHAWLNYFTYDTVAPAPGHTFGVLGAAVALGHSLTATFSVRAANPERLPLDLTLVLDRSDSMSADGGMAFTKRGLSLFTSHLRDGDRVDLVLFGSGVCTPLEGFVVGRDDPVLLQRALAEARPNGGSDLTLGLQEAYRVQAARDATGLAGRNRRVLVSTDDGRVDPAAATLVARHREQDHIHLSVVAIGRPFDDRELRRLVKSGDGMFVSVASHATVDRVFGSRFDALVNTVAQDVRLLLELPPSLAMARLPVDAPSEPPEGLPFHAGAAVLHLQELRFLRPPCDTPNRCGEIVTTDLVRLRILFRDPATDQLLEEVFESTVGALLSANQDNVGKALGVVSFVDWAETAGAGGDPCGGRRPFWSSADEELEVLRSLVDRRCGPASVGRPYASP